MTERGFPMVSVVSILLKIVAVLALLMIGYLFFDSLISIITTVRGEPSILKQQGVYGKIIGQLGLFFLMFIGIPAIVWGLSDMLMLLRDINYNTQIAVADKMPVAPEMPQSFTVPPVSEEPPTQQA